MNKVLGAVLAVFLVPGAVSASTIDFETFANGDQVTNVLSDDGRISGSIRIAANAGSSNEARIYNTNILGGADPDLERPFFIDQTDTPDTSFDPGNVLIIQEAEGIASDIPDDSANGGKIFFTFANAVDFTGFTIIDDARIKVTGDGQNFGVFEVTRDRGFGVFSDLQILGVTTLEFDFFRSSGAIDNLTFTTPVPVPAALPLMLAGVAGFGVVARRRKKRAA